MEHIVMKHIANHIDQHNILTQFQHGFRQARSCETQLLTTMHDLMQHWDMNVQIDLAVLDFSKAFDTVPHNRLLGKLQHYGINGQIHKWIESFLGIAPRALWWMVHNQVRFTWSLEFRKVLFSDMLFLLHINDLPRNVSSTVRLFADDCLLYRPIRNSSDQVALQNDLDSLTEWCSTWGMRFNANKCEVMRIARTRNPLRKMYTISGQILKEVAKAKYLGVAISDDLQWSGHVSAITKKANSTLAFLRRNLKNAPPKVKETAYFSLVRSVIEYSASVWDSHLQKDINTIEMVQRRAARIVKNDYLQTSSVTQMLQDLGWESLADRRRDMRLVLLYKIIHHLAAVPTEGILIPADPRTRSNHPHKFKTVQSSTTVFRNSYFVNTIPTWNCLRSKVVESPSVPTFKL